MSIKADVTNMLQVFTADVEITDTALRFYGPAWEIGLLLGLIPIKGKVKELLRIEYTDIAAVVVEKTTRPFSKKDACLIRLQNGRQVEVRFTPFDAGCAMLYEKIPNLFVRGDTQP